MSFSVPEGKTLGLVGESGCGKSTTARLVAGLIPPTSGQIFMGGARYSKLREKDIRELRRDVQMVFQDPYGSLNPRMRIQDIVGCGLTIYEGLKGNGAAKGGMVARPRWAATGSCLSLPS